MVGPSSPPNHYVEGNHLRQQPGDLQLSRHWPGIEDGYSLRKLQEAKEVLEREKFETVNVMDPDCRLIKEKRGVIQPSPNGQIAVDENDRVNVAADVIQNVTDRFIASKAALAHLDLKWHGRKPSSDLRSSVNSRREFSC